MLAKLLDREVFSPAGTYGRIVVHTDGGCRNNQGDHNEGAYALVLRYETHSKVYGYYEENTTNNRMELLAILDAMKAIHDKDKEVVIISDSNYSVKGINEWMEGWKKNNWKRAKNKELKNADIWKEVYEEKQKFKSILFHHVKGHSGDVYNDEVDAIVNEIMDGELLPKE